MQPFIVIRKYTAADELNCQELIRDYIISFARKCFFCLCFREITLQFIVISWAIFFIFFNVPLKYLCFLTVPCCIFVLFLTTYFSFYSKAIELMKIKPSQCLVAECYEPFIFRCQPSEVSYQIFMDDAPFEESFKNKFRKKIVGTVSVEKHNSLYNALCIYRFAIRPGYPYQKIAEPMINHLIAKNYLSCSSLECTISEWQENERDFFDMMGFTTRQIYHKQIIGRSLTVLKTQLSYDFSKIKVNKEV